MLGGGAAARAGILGLLKDSQRMVRAAVADRALMTGNKDNDLIQLTDMYNQFQLAADRGFIFNRLSDQIKMDLHTRIRAGQVPSNIYEILSQRELDPTMGLTQIAPEQMESTFASLGQAKTTAQKNAELFVAFFSKSMSSVLKVLKAQADADGEPNIAAPALAPNRAGQARVCLLLASSLSAWPSEIDPGLCKGLSYESLVTGKRLDFDTYFAQVQSHSTRVPQRMCTFYRFYRESENFTHERQGP
jgi:hypothetical protein